MTASDWVEAAFRTATVLSCVLLWWRVRRIERVVESADGEVDRD